MKFQFDHDKTTHSKTITRFCSLPIQLLAGFHMIAKQSLGDWEGWDAANTQSSDPIYYRHFSDRWKSLVIIWKKALNIVNSIICFCSKVRETTKLTTNNAEITTNRNILEHHTLLLHRVFQTLWDSNQRTFFVCVLSLTVPLTSTSEPPCNFLLPTGLTSKSFDKSNSACLCTLPFLPAPCEWRTGGTLLLSFAWSSRFCSSSCSRSSALRRAFPSSLSCKILI